MNKLTLAQEAKDSDAEQNEKDRLIGYTEHIQKLQVDMEMQRRELTGEFQNVLKDVTHKLELFKAQAQSQGPNVNVSGSYDDTGIKETINKAMNKKRKRTVKFIDDDNAEIIDEGVVE